jgi:hypothetical protein
MWPDYTAVPYLHSDQTGYLVTIEDDRHGTLTMVIPTDGPVPGSDELHEQIVDEYARQILSRDEMG